MGFTFSLTLTVRGMYSRDGRHDHVVVAAVCSRVPRLEWLTSAAEESRGIRCSSRQTICDAVDRVQDSDRPHFNGFLRGGAET